MKKDNLIFLHKVLKAIADSIIKIFIPLFILKETGSLFLSMEYLALYSFFTLIFMFLFKKIIQKYGVITIILHFIPIIVTEAVLSFSSLSILSIAICSILMSISQALYSIPLNLIFTFGDKKSNVAKFQISTNIGKLFFTIFSGLILSSAIKNSFLIMSIASSIFYIISVIPIGYAYKELKENYNSFKATKHKDNKIDKKFKIFHASFGLFQATIDNVVPLFLYINNLSFQSITIFIALVELCKVMVNYLTKQLIKINKQKLACSISFTIFILSLICTLTIKNSLLLYIFSCLLSITFPLTFVPMFKLYCGYATETQNIFECMTNRDVDIFSFRPAYYCTTFIGLGLYPCFAVGFISTIVMFVYELKLLNKYVSN